MGSPSRLFRTGESDAYGQAAQMAEQAALDAAKKDPTAAKWIAKGETVAADTAAGCTLGPWGCVGGAAVGVVQAFSGDVAEAFNPQDFTGADYDRMARFCVNGGGANNAPRGTIVPGVPPDQDGACRYTDYVGDSFSGGDAPFPGSWNWGRDGAVIRDQAAFDRWHGPLCGGAPLPPGMVCINDQAYAPEQLCGGSPLPAGLLCFNGRALTQVQIDALKKGAAATQKVLSNQKAVSSLLRATASKVPAAKTPSSVVAAFKTSLDPKAMTTVLNRIDTNAHTIVALAASGDPSAQNAVADIAMKAQAGDPHAQTQAAILTQAAKIQIRAKYIQKYVYGGRTSTGAAPCCAGCSH
jgi:hypothetical protein